jgi:hypothetical protein
MIDESHVRELREAGNDGAALVVLEGGPRVIDSASGHEEGT